MFVIGLGLAAYAAYRVLFARAGVGRPKPLDIVLLVLGVTVAGAGAPSPSVLQKAVATLIMPVGLLWIGLIAAAIVARGKARSAVLLLLVGYTLLGNTWLGAKTLGHLEAPFRSIDPLSQTEAFDAVFVLGGGSSLTPRGEPQLGPAGDRIRIGAMMYRLGHTPVLVASGSGIAGFTGSWDISAQTRALWQQMGVPAEAILVLPEPQNTSQEIARYAALVRERGWRRVGLVTSAWHLPRALARCRDHGLEMEPLPADFAGVPPPFGWVWMIPTPGGFNAFHRAAWEFVGRLVGR